MQKTISPIDNKVYVEREYHSDKIEETINNSVKAQTGWMNLSVKERVAVSYTHLRAHETLMNLVCRLLLGLILMNTDKAYNCLLYTSDAADE